MSDINERDVYLQLRDIQTTHAFLPGKIPQLAGKAADEIKRLMTECEAWRECARYDAMMEGPRFAGWDRSALNRCRKKYIETSPEGK
jgi:hypothetical protein